MKKVPLRDWQIILLADVLRETGLNHRNRWANSGVRQLTEQFKRLAAATTTAKRRRRRLERAVRIVRR